MTCLPDADATVSPVDRLYEDVREMCRTYCQAHSCSWSTLGRAALNDTMFIKSIMEGESVTTKKVRKLETFLIANQPPNTARRQAAPQEASS